MLSYIMYLSLSLSSLPPSLPLSSFSRVVFPDQVNHAVAPPSSVEIVADLGPEFVTTFTVGNLGPSIIPTSKLTIYWPLNVTDSDQYYLYPTGLTVIQVGIC